MLRHSHSLISRAAGAASLALVISAASASAQTNPQIFCTATNWCNAAAFEFHDYIASNGTQETLFSVYFQNLQGSFSRATPGRANDINFFSFWFHNSGLIPYFPPHTWAVSLDQRGTAVGNIQRGSATHFSNDLAMNDAMTQFYAEPITRGIAGCDLNDYYEESKDFVFRSCPSQGLNGWARFDFRMFWYNAPAAPVRFDDFLFSFGNSQFSKSNRCSVGVIPNFDVPGPSPCEVLDYGATVTPEPSVAMLLAPALASLGIVARRRRRTIT